MKAIMHAQRLVLISIVLLLAACATTQPSAVSVADAQAAADDTKVVLDVQIAQHLEEDRYMVYDPSGEIVALIDEDILGKVQLAPRATVRLYGVIDRDEDASVVKVKKLQVIEG